MLVIKVLPIVSEIDAYKFVYTIPKTNAYSGFFDNEGRYQIKIMSNKDLVAQQNDYYRLISANEKAIFQY